MQPRRDPKMVAIALGVGLIAGYLVSESRTPRLLASGNDRYGERALVAGPISIGMTADKIPVAQDALYYLNYSTGKLLASIPDSRQSIGRTQVVSDFAERDLIADFGIRPGMNPHFLMTTGHLGNLSDGNAPLFVVETETGQVVTYKLSLQSTSGSNRPTFTLVERKSDPRLGRSQIER